MKIVVFGLGYVGTVSAACLADAGHHVVGVDINPTKVNLINEGQSPIVEQDVPELLARVVREGRLRATTDAAEAMVDAQLSLVCVGTPDRPNGSPEMRAVISACEDIGRQLAHAAPDHVVVMRSTILPGTMAETVVPTLETHANTTLEQGLHVCFNPEFLREGSSIVDFYSPPFTLIGASDDVAFETAAELYGHLDAPLLRTSVATAEMVKFVSNAYHALKVTFANEIGSLCKERDIDSHEVMEIFSRDTKLNISSAYLRPGFAFGGSCLPKDLKALLYMGRHLDLNLPVLEAILPSNEQQIQNALDMVVQTGKRKVGVLGFSFKAGTDDLRHSAQVELIERLIGKGFDVSLYDRNVSLARLHGANKAYIEREIPHIATLMRDSMEEVLAEGEVIVVGNGDPQFNEAVGQLRNDQVLIDLVRLKADVQALNGQYQGIAW